MTVVLKIDVKAPPAGVTVRAWRDIMRAAFAEAGKLWHSEMLPKHFGSNARRNYPGEYAQRSIKWLLRKLRISPTEVRLAMGSTARDKMSAKDRAAYWREYAQTAERVIESRGGPQYLVGTGTLRQLSRLATFRAYPSRFSVQIQGTAYTPTKQRPGSNQPHLVGELLATTKTERERLRIVISKKINEGVKHFFEHGQVPPAQRTGIF